MIERALSWSSKKQELVSLSTSKAEYIATTSAACQEVWISRLVADFFYQKATEIFCDNRSAIAMSKKPTFHSRTKRIYILYHIIRRLVSNGEITERWRMQYCRRPHV